MATHSNARRRSRTLTQQQQNKLAQKRYREKRKQKNFELEQRVEQLMAQLNAVRDGHAAWPSDEAIALRNQVAEQKRTIDNLRLELKTMALVADTHRPATAALEQASPCGGDGANRVDPSPRRPDGVTPEDALAQIVALVGCVQSALASKG